MLVSCTSQALTSHAAAMQQQESACLILVHKPCIGTGIGFSKASLRSRPMVCSCAKTVLFFLFKIQFSQFSAVAKQQNEACFVVVLAGMQLCCNRKLGLPESGASGVVACQAPRLLCSQPLVVCGGNTHKHAAGCFVKTATTCMRDCLQQHQPISQIPFV